MLSWIFEKADITDKTSAVVLSIATILPAKSLSIIYIKFTSNVAHEVDPAPILSPAITGLDLCMLIIQAEAAIRCSTVSYLAGT